MNKNKIYKGERIRNNMKMVSKRGNSHFDFKFENQFIKSKRSQLTIFIIIAIVIVAVVLILFWNRIGPIIGIGVANDPQAYLQNCLGDKVKEGINLASARGGSINPVHAISYQGEQIEYLCFTNEYYKTCTMQQPLLKEHVEYEVNNYIQEDVKNCMSSFEDAFSKKGYSVNMGKVASSAEIVPGSVNINVNSPITLSKGEEVLKYNKISIPFKSGLYDLLMISASILNWEARYGDSAPENFMMYYPNLKIQKLKQGDGSKIYILTDLASDDSFTFASRSLSWPAGYGVGEKV